MDEDQKIVGLKAEEEQDDSDVSPKIRSDFRPTSYPRSGKRLQLEATPIGLRGSLSDTLTVSGHTVVLSTDGIEFRSSEIYKEGSLIRLEVEIPNFWDLKQGLVEYSRIDAPRSFRVLGRVIRNKEVSKRGKKNLVTVETLVMDDIDKQVLFNYLKD